MRPNWFVGLAPHHESLERIYQTIYASPPRGLRAYDVYDLHVTVAFLGAIDAEVATNAWNEIMLSLRAGTVRLGRAQLFGRASRATALGFNVGAVQYGEAHGAAADAAFRESVASDRDALLQAAGRPADPRRARPHLTIARLPRGLTPLQRRTVIKWAEGIRVEELLRVDIAALYRSADRVAGEAEGRRYAIIDQRQLPASS